MLNYNKKTLEQVKLEPEHFIQLLKAVESKKLTELKAKDILRSWKIKSSQLDLKGETIISNKSELQEIVKKVLASKDNQKAIEDYKSGNKQTLNFLIGAVMKLSNKRADFKTAKELLEKELK
jgi:aspartyl-tRNA(Asn)/glutamyl-tRNA(Gln) amidotransferase subunit B